MHEHICIPERENIERAATENNMRLLQAIQQDSDSNFPSLKILFRYTLEWFVLVHLLHL